MGEKENKKKTGAKMIQQKKNTVVCKDYGERQQGRRSIKRGRKNTEHFVFDGNKEVVWEVSEED